MTAFIAGAYEHPRRVIPDRTLAEVHAEVAAGALADAGLSVSDVDGYFCAGDVPGWAAVSLAEYLGLRPSYLDSTDLGGASYVAHVGRAARAIEAGLCSVALITLGGLPRQGVSDYPVDDTHAPGRPFEAPYAPTTAGLYALAAARHRYEFGTTAEQLALVKVAASKHAAHNPAAFLGDEVTVEQVLDSPLVADPLHRMDCCVVTDGGGALVVVSPSVAASLDRRSVRVLGWGESTSYARRGRVDLTRTAAVRSGPAAFGMAGIAPSDVDYASVYDSFTITLLLALEDLGFCEKGKGGAFVADGALLSGGPLPVNTDGGGLCNNHPANRGGMTKVVEAVRQLRGEATPAVQVPGCEVAIAHGTGGFLGLRSASATVVLGV